MEQVNEKISLLDIFSPTEVLRHKDLCGQKSYRLAELVKSGYKVPNFLVLGKALTGRLTGVSIDDPLYETVVVEIQKKLDVGSYAVRSSAFLEDGKNHSHAGMFSTKLNVNFEDLISVIHEVIADALKKGSATDTHPFSLIVQEYISPDKAGVLFTRDPQGAYLRVIEWKEGSGMGVVQGEGSQSLTFSCTGMPEYAPFQGFEELVASSLSIEEMCVFPQDIEWCIKGGDVWILQTRPITTLSASQYEGFRLLDKENLKEAYYFDSESLQDSFSYAPPLAVDVIKKALYDTGGAIERAYRSIGLHISGQNRIRVFGHAVYIDKEAELKQVFPAYSYFGKKTLTPHIATMRGFLHTLKNTYILSRVSSENKEGFYKNFDIHVERIQSIKPNASSEVWIKTLSETYCDIFLVNLYAQKAYRALENALQGSPIAVPEALAAQHARAQNKFTTPISIENILGNSLNIFDRSVFVTKTQGERVDATDKVTRWLQSLSHAQRTRTERSICLAQEFEMLRERGRLLSVLCVSGLRNSLEREFSKQDTGLKSDLMYYATLVEIQNMTWKKEVLLERKKDFERVCAYTLPSRIASLPRVTQDDIFGISSGIAEGVVSFNKDGLSKEVILYTDTLRPELATLLPNIGGIISRNGNILAHLAIVAREYGVPVVVDTKGRYEEGDSVRIDGGKGVITRFSGDNSKVLFH